MFGRKKKQKPQKTIVPYVYRQPKNSTDARLREIYLRYHEKKPITLDDLRYLWEKDPESCEKFTRNLVHPEIDPMREETQKKVIVYIKGIENELLRTQHSLDAMKPVALETVEEVRESMANVRHMITTMSQHELSDLMEHLNTASELREHCEDELEGWKQFLTETTVYDTTEEESKMDVKV